LKQMKQTPIKSLHLVIVRWLIKAIFRERRFAKMAALKNREECAEHADAILPEEMPRGASMCGWMRNEREAKLFEKFLRANGGLAL